MLTPKWIIDSGARRLLIISLDWKMNNGNTGRGNAWFRSNKERRELRTLIQEQHGFGDPFLGPVVVVITRVLGPREHKWDSDSQQRGTVKQLLDAMVELRYFTDDSPKWITHVTCNQDDQDRDMGPALRVQVFEDCYEDVRTA